MRKTFDVVRRQTALILPSSASVFWGWTQDAGTQRGNRLGYPRQWSAGRHLYRPRPSPGPGRKQIEIAKETRRKLLHARLPPIAPGTDSEERMSQCSYIIRNAGMERLHSRCIG
jgi:hypothetical protein